MFKYNFLYFSFCLLALDLSLHSTEKSLAASSRVLPITYLFMWMRMRFPLPHLEAKQLQCYQPLLVSTFFFFFCRGFLFLG